MYAGVRWPHAAIVVVVLSPIVDRYLVSGLLPRSAVPIATMLSEALLLSVTIAVVAVAVRRRTLVTALRHPTTGLLAAFVVVAAASTALNAVPIRVAALGLLFTLDAVVLFYVARMVTWSRREVTLAIGAFVALVVAAALVALAQAILRPDVLGLYVMTGQFGELYRLASFIGDPNVLGAFIGAAAPFVLLAATNLPSPTHRRIAIAIAFLLLLILWLTFSRGAWVAMAAALAFGLAWYGRRTLLLALVLLVATFLAATFMPRDLILHGDDVGVRPNVIGSTFGRVGAVGEGRDLRTMFVINAIPILRDHPLFGVGPGRYGGAVAFDTRTPIYDEYETDEIFALYPPQETVDNFWLHILVEAGIVGTLAFLAAAGLPGLRILRAGIRAVGADRIILGGIATGAIALAISSGSTMLLEANSVGFLFWFLLGIGTVVVEWVRRERDAAIVESAGSAERTAPGRA